MTDLRVSSDGVWPKADRQMSQWVTL